MPERVHCMLGVIGTHLLLSSCKDVGLCFAGAACWPSTSQQEVGSVLPGSDSRSRKQHTRGWSVLQEERQQQQA